MNITFNTYPTTTMPSICAGPFTVSFSARSIACGAEYELSLCAYGSKSYSHFSVANEDKLYLIPRWRFLDTNFNIVTSVPVTGIVSTGNGITGSASFYYVDDMPSSAVLINVEVNNILNYPLSSCNVDDVPTNIIASITTPLYISEWDPQLIKYTSDGINDINNKWTEHPIKWYATLHPYENGPIIFSSNYTLTTSLISSTNLMSISSFMCPDIVEVHAFDKRGNYGWASGSCLTMTSSNNTIFFGNLSSEDIITIVDKQININQEWNGSNYTSVQQHTILLESPLLSGIDYILSFSGTNNNNLSSSYFEMIPRTPPPILVPWPIYNGPWISNYNEDNQYPVTLPLIYDRIAISLFWDGANPPPAFLPYSIDYKFNFKATKSFSSINSICNVFKIRPFEQPFEIRRRNESWDATKSIKSYAMAPHLNSKYNLWDNFVGHSVGQVNAGQQLGRKSYERIANFPANHIDIDESNIKQLYSISQYLDVPIDDYDLNYPPELQRLIDIGSISHSKLWGEIVKCNLNITDNQICPRCGYKHTNLSDKIEDPFNYAVTAGVPFIQHDRFNMSPDGWTIEYPPMLYYVSHNWERYGLTSSWSSVNVTSEGRYILATRKNELYISNDYGNTWTINENITPSPTIVGVAVSDDTKYQAIACSGGTVFVSSNSGNNWASVGLPTSISWKEIAMSRDGQYISALFDAGVYVSSDYGVSWIQTYTISSNLWRLAMNGTGQYQLIGRSGISSTQVLLSNDYGQTWNPVINLKWTRSLAISNNGKYMLVTGNIGTSSPYYIWLSQDYGITWQRLDNYAIGTGTGIDGHYEGAVISGNGKYMITFIQSHVQYTSCISNDYGNHWQFSNESPAGNNRCNASMNDNGVVKCLTNGELWRTYPTIDLLPINGGNTDLCEVSTIDDLWYLSSYPMSFLTAYNLDLCSYYDYYEYLDGYPRLETCDPLDPRYVQAAGVINRNDEYNTLDVYSVSSVEDWFGDDGKLQEAIEYELLRGLQLNSQTCNISS